MRHRLYRAGCLIFLLLLCQHASACAAAVSAALQLCLTSVIPALFPFFAASTLAVSCGMAQAIGALCAAPFRTLFHLPACGAAVLFVSFLGGYPAGARMAAQLYRDGQCTREQAADLAAVCNNTGPAFLIGMCGNGVFHSLHAGIFLYCVHIISAVLTALVLRPKNMPAPAKPDDFPQTLRAAPLFVQAVLSAGCASLHVSAFVLVFSVILSLARQTGLFSLVLSASSPLCSACGLSLDASLCAAAMLPLAASTVYAENMTIGGYYIIHLVFGFWGAALWLKAARQRRKRNTAAFAAICLVEGLCSVRYVLCFLCPMVVVAGLDGLLSSGRRTLRDTHTRFLGVTLAGFAAGGWAMPHRKSSIRGCLSAASAGRARLCSTRWTARRWGRRFGRSSRISSSSSAGGAARRCFRRRAQPTC